jgi:hypothetical protein
MPGAVDTDQEQANYDASYTSFHREGARDL